MKLTVKFFLFLFSIYSFSQVQSKKNIKTKIEVFIVENKTDSVSYYLNKLENDEDLENYQKMLNKQQVPYPFFYKFLIRMGGVNSLSFDKISFFINNYIKEPTDTKKINLDYVEIKWIQVTELREKVSLDEASLEQKKLEKYINKFKDTDVEVIRAKAKITTHPIVMFLIKKDIKNGKELCLKSLETARKLNDQYLEIAFLYHLSDFLVFERKLDEYIKVSEQSLEIEKELPKKSSYYYAVVEHLIDAYIFKGGNNKRVLNLIDILNNDDETKIDTYILYIKLLASLEKGSKIRNEILEKFEVKNSYELIKKLEILAKDLNSNDKFRFYEESSIALASENLYKEALFYNNKTLVLNQEIYSEELANSLANFKIEQAVKIKQKEIEYEKGKNKFYVIIIILTTAFLVISFLVILKIKEQSKLLSEKNIIINDALKENKLLVKEVHHRVKNNFQIITSLLELQSEEIKDEKALKLFNDGKYRVKSMALIHQKLYKNQSDFIDLNDYIISLLNEISSIYKTGKEVIKTIKVKNIFLDVETAIPLGLMINEIVTNTYKYAFKDKRDGINEISIEIEKQNDMSYKLIIQDNGVGIPKDFNIEKSKSIGLKLVKRLIKQLHGNFVLIRKPGTRFELTFKDASIRNQIE